MPEGLLAGALHSPVVKAVLGCPSVWQAAIAERGTAPRRGRAGLSGSWGRRKKRVSIGSWVGGRMGGWRTGREGIVSVGKVST